MDFKPSDTENELDQRKTFLFYSYRQEMLFWAHQRTYETSIKKRKKKEYLSYHPPKILGYGSSRIGSSQGAYLSFQSENLLTPSQEAKVDWGHLELSAYTDVYS